MPHLVWGGLSETWLLRELGHRHWMLIAEAAGLDTPAFVDAAGRTVYAAFCGLSVRDAAFHTLGEHDDLFVCSELARVSRTQFASRHCLSKAGCPVGVVDLTSVFVTRKAPGENRTITRSAVEGLPPMPIQPDFAPITATALAIRNSAWTRHFGFEAGDSTPLGRHVIQPCPSQDFNGAGLLYCSSYQGFLDRAEWALLGAEIGPATTLARDIVFLGNADVGQDVVIELRGMRRRGREVAHRCRIATMSGQPLAEAFTRRRACSAS